MKQTRLYFEGYSSRNSFAIKQGTFDGEKFTSLSANYGEVSVSPYEKGFEIVHSSRSGPSLVLTTTSNPEEASRQAHQHARSLASKLSNLRFPLVDATLERESLVA